MYEVDGEHQDAPIMFDPNIPIYGDGSASNPSQPAIARASLALAQVDADGQPLRVLTASVPNYLPQTAAVAERLCLVVANKHLPSVHLAPYVGDCKGALVLANVAKARHPRHMHAGLVRNMLADGVKISSTRWVKAHQCLEDLPAPDLEVVANALVDDKADAANTAFALSPAVFNSYRADLTNCKAVLRAAAQMLDLWPDNRALYGTLQRVRNSDANGARSNARRPHNFVWRQDRWFCTSCFRVKATIQSAIDKVSCTEVPRALMAVVKANANATAATSHKLFLAADHVGLLVAFCSACGAHTSLRPRNLMRPCEPVRLGKHSHGAKALRAFFGLPSKHPETGLRLSRPYPVALSDFEFAQSADFEPFESTNFEATSDEPLVDEGDLHDALDGPFDASHEDGWFDGFEDFDQP